MLAAEHHDDAEPVNLGADHEVSIRELAEQIAQLTGFEGDLVLGPDQARRPAPPARRRVQGRARCSAGGPRCPSTRACAAPSTGTWPTATKPSAPRTDAPSRRSADVLAPADGRLELRSALRLRARTSRASGSWKSREQREAAQPQHGVVEHRVGRPGRGPGRLEVGGGDRRRPGRGRARPPPAPLGRTRTSDTAPWLVTWCRPGRRSTARRRSIGARSAVKVGMAPLVVDEAQLGRARPARRRIVFTMLAPCSPHTHDVRTMVAPPARPPARRPASSGRRPTAGRARPTRCRAPALVAGEHVVGRHVHEVGAGAPAGLGHPAHGEGVRGEGPVGVGLAGVDRGPGRGVDDGVGPRRVSDGAEHRVAVGRRRASAVVARRPRRRRPPAQASTTSRPSCPPAPVTRTRMSARQAVDGGPLLQRLPPPAVVAVPGDRGGERLVESRAGRQPSASTLAGRDRVAAVVAEPVGDRLDERLVATASAPAARGSSSRLVISLPPPML